MSDFVCLYFGPPNECIECGGTSFLGFRFCSHDCADSYAERGAVMDAKRQDRRNREDALAAAGAVLREQGYSDHEIDTLLAGMPT